MVTEDQKMVASALGYASYEDLVSTGVTATCTKNWRKDYNVNIFHADPFYASYSRASEVRVASNMMLTTEAIAMVKKRIKAKHAQERKLENIREIAIEKIIDFIADSFRIPRALVQRGDISWKEYCTFVVGGVIFRYDGTISDEYFNIHDTVHKTYKDAYEDYKGIINFYMKKNPYLEDRYI